MSKFHSHHVFIQLSHDLDVQNSIKHPNVQKKKKKKVKTSITFFVCLGLKRAENIFGGYRKISLSKIIFVYKGDPLKKVNFSPPKNVFFLAFVNSRNIHFVKMS